MENIYYTLDHEWLKIEENKVTVGITNFAQEQLGDIVFVDLPAAGTELLRDKFAAVIESVKAAGDVNSPLDGKVIAINLALDSDPELVNKDPEGEGWLFQLKVDEEADTTQFMDREAYHNYLHHA